MGGHHPQGGSTGPGEQMSRFDLKKKYCTSIIKTKVFHLGPVPPSSGEGTQLSLRQLFRFATTCMGVLVEDQGLAMY